MARHHLASRPFLSPWGHALGRRWGQSRRWPRQGAPQGADVLLARSRLPSVQGLPPEGQVLEAPAIILTEEHEAFKETLFLDCSQHETAAAVKVHLTSLAFRRHPLPISQEKKSGGIPGSGWNPAVTQRETRYKPGSFRPPDGPWELSADGAPGATWPTTLTSTSLGAGVGLLQQNPFRSHLLISRTHVLSKLTWKSGGAKAAVWLIAAG